MIPPPQQGNVYDTIPPNIGNPEAWGVVAAWEAWQLFAGQAIDQSLAELQGLDGIPV